MKLRDSDAIHGLIDRWTIESSSPDVGTPCIVQTDTMTCCQSWLVNDINRVGRMVLSYKKSKKVNYAIILYMCVLHDLLFAIISLILKNRMILRIAISRWSVMMIIVVDLCKNMLILLTVFTFELP